MTNFRPVQTGTTNIDRAVVEGFGDEWTRFDQSDLAPAEAQKLFDSYFSVFPWHELPPRPVGLDLGCGSGRWARLVAPRVERLHCIDASPAALAVARRTLAGASNCEFHLASVDQIPLPDSSADFAYSLGVLHHTPDTQAALRACVSKVRRGGWFLLYLYYRFDNRPRWYAMLWRASEIARFIISRLPRTLRSIVSQMIAATIYLPLARFALLAERAGMNVERFPLGYYRDRSFYVMRTDALDRFGTRLEKRFTRVEIEAMMRDAGLDDVVFSEQPPFWCAAGRRVR